MIKKFNINNNLKGRITTQLGQFVTDGAISFEKGAKRNTHIVVVNEAKIQEIDNQDYGYSTVASTLKYLYHMIGTGREVRE